MKIMLIAEPRTGSMSIGNYFFNANPKYSVFLEPFNVLKNPPENYSNLLTNKNLFIKQILNQLPKEHMNLGIDRFYDMVFNDFDKVVFLSRRDLQKQSESLSSALISDNWEKPYMYDEKKDFIKLDLSLKKLSDLKNKLNEIANKYNKEIFYYEDLFNDRNSMNNFLIEIQSAYNEKAFKKYLDPSKKYRGEKTIKSII